jgi:mono/diheme cytochrome c family protein
MTLRRFGPIALLAAASFDLSAAQDKPPPPPLVPGFERFGAADPVEAGRLLLGELNCVACHRAEGPAAEYVQAKQAPVLTDAGRRFRPDWLRAWIADPGRVNPGTTMPHAVRDPADVEPLVHYLASLRAGKAFEEGTGPAGKARDLYHQAGCAACHAPRDPAAEPSRDKAVVPLPDLKEKYASAAALAAFLVDPLRWRPSGRMPKMNLTLPEATAIATHFVGLPPREADNPAETAPGIAYEYFEGSWGKIPDFDALKPVATGVAFAFDTKLCKKEDNIGLRFRGYLDVPQDGLYTFYTISDDGSRLFLGRTLVVNNDGTHPPQEASGALYLKKGKHALTVEWFEGGGGEELKVQWEGPGLPKRPIPPGLLAHPRAGRLEIRESGGAEPPFVPDPARTARGRQAFLQSCVSCHAVAPEDKPALSAPLAALRGKTGGCLSESPPAGAPRYGLSALQREALRAAVERLNDLEKPSPARRLERVMTALNCFACHERAGKGGPEPGRNASFLGSDPTIGDEGRIPPSLTGAGAKLRRDWMQALLANGTKVRPYMLARMPVFGAANVGTLAEDFERADLAAPEAPAPAKDRTLVKAGRQLTGTKGLSCVTCHMYAGHKSLGIPGMDLVHMGTRLRRDWFTRYLLEPGALRPGTRMPTFWPEGKSVLQTVLDGNASLQVEALWQYLSEGGKGQAPLGIGPEPIPLVAKDEPILYRNFIQGAGPRAIGVGYPERVNLAFDANHLRLALLWQGEFIDASKHWVDRGAGFQAPAGDNVVALPDAPPFATLADAKAPWPAAPKASLKAAGFEFRGYDLDAKRRPTFLYSWGTHEVADHFEPLSATSLRRTVTVTGAGPGGWYLGAAAKKIERQAEGSYRTDAGLKVRLTLAAGVEPLLQSSGAGTELRVPVRAEGGKAVIVQEYSW